MRSGMDVDLLCELDESHIEELLRLIGSDYYASKPATTMRFGVSRNSI